MPDSETLRLHVVLSLEAKPLLALKAEIPPGMIFSVMGPSGSGKSALLAWVAGFLDPVFQAEGEAWLGSERITNLPAEKRRAGILFQDPLLFPHMSVRGNLLFALPPDVKGRRAREAAADAILVRMGLEGFGLRDPATLSGGQKARVALARTLLSRPRLLLLDEPFSKLDAELRGEVRSLVFGEAQERGLPALLVTHDRADAAAAGGPVHILSA